MSMKTVGLSIAFGAVVQSSLGNAFKTINEKSKGIEESLKKIKFKKELSGSVVKLQKEFNTLKKAEHSAGGASIGLKKKIYESAKALRDAKQEARKYGIELKNASKMQHAFSKLGEIKAKNGRSISSSLGRKNYRDGAKSQMLDKFAMGMAIAAPFKAGIEFESSMKRVQALSGATGEEFKKLQDTAKKLGATTTFSATQSAEAMQYLSMAGFKTDDTIKAMPGLLDLAAAGQTDLATTADITSNILSGFGIKAGKTSHVADVMAKAMTSANVDTRMLGETMKYVAPSASGLGASLEEVTTLTAKLGDVGIQGSDAGTALRSMYSRMASPPTEASAVIAKLGLQTKDASGKFVGMMNILGQLQEKTKDMSNTEQADAMKKLFGMEAMSGAIALMKVPVEQLKKYEKGLEHADGTAKKIAKEQNDSVAGAFKSLSSAIEGVSISATTLFLPAIKGMAQGITSLTSGLNSFIENHKTLATLIGGVAGGMIALSVVAFGLRYAFSFVADGMGSLWRAGRSVVFWMSAEGRMLAWNRVQLMATAIKTKTLALWQGILAIKTKAMTLWTTRSAIAQKGAALASGGLKIAMAGLNFVMSANPIGLVVLAIGGLVTGLVWAYNKFGWFREGVSKAWGYVKTIFKWSPMGLLMQGFGKAFDWLSSKFDWFHKSVDKLKSVGSTISSFFGFGGDEKESKKPANNPKFEPAKAMKKVAVATAMTTSLAVAQPVVPLAAQNTNINNVQTKKQEKKESHSQHNTYSITLHIKSDSKPQDISQAVKKAIAEIESSKRDRSFSDEEL